MRSTIRGGDTRETHRYWRMCILEANLKACNRNCWPGRFWKKWRPRHDMRELLRRRLADA